MSDFMECIHADISAKSYMLKYSQANKFWKSIGKHSLSN